MATVTVTWVVAVAAIITDGAADAAITTAGPGTVIIVAIDDIACAEAASGWLLRIRMG